MDLSKCNCEKSGFCPVFRRDMDNKNHHWCKTSTKNKRINYYQQNVGVYKPQKNFGIIIPCFNKIGGVETWLKSICKHFAGDISEICVISENPDSSLYQLGVPVSTGRSSATKMCSTHNKVLIWGEQIIDPYLSKGRPKKLMFIHHGDEYGIWANHTFDIQSSYADKLIAVNKNVADKYNCTLIENYIDQERCSKSYSPDSKTVLWAHRMSSEKRPLMLLEIARQMQDYNFIVCGEGNLKEQVLSEMPKNCTYLGSPRNLCKVLEKCAVFISTADQEAFGYSLGEAIGSNIPVVSYKFGLGVEYSDFSLELNSTIEDWVAAINSCSGERSKHSQKLLDRYNEKIFCDKWSRIICG